ncbi:MAG: hypothetical protein ACM30I_00620 [Gemmatimonas sp.]
MSLVAFFGGWFVLSLVTAVPAARVMAFAKRKDMPEPEMLAAYARRRRFAVIDGDRRRA